MNRYGSEFLSSLAIVLTATVSHAQQANKVTFDNLKTGAPPPGESP